MRLTERAFHTAFELEQTHGDARCDKGAECDGEGKERRGGLLRKVGIERCASAEDRNEEQPVPPVFQGHISLRPPWPGSAG